MLVPSGHCNDFGPLSYVIQVRGGQRWKCHVDHIRGGPSVHSRDLENNSNDTVEDDHPFPLSPSSRAGVDWDTLAPPAVEVRQSLKGQELDSE